MPKFHVGMYTVAMTKRVDYQNENGDYEAAQAKRRSEIRAHAKAEHEAFERDDSAFEETANAIYPIDGDATGQPDGAQHIEETSPSEQDEYREEDVHSPIEEADEAPVQEEEVKEEVKPAPKKAAAQKKTAPAKS